MRVIGALDTPVPYSPPLRAMSLHQRRTVLLDVRTGRVRREEKGILPAGPRAHWAGMLPLPDPDALASRLFTDLDGALIALEPDGRRREIVAAVGVGR